MSSHGHGHRMGPFLDVVKASHVYFRTTHGVMLPYVRRSRPSNQASWPGLTFQTDSGDSCGTMARYTPNAGPSAGSVVIMVFFLGLALPYLCIGAALKRCVRVRVCVCVRVRVRVRVRVCAPV